MLGSSEVIRRLGRLHMSPWRGWPQQLSARLTGGLELLLLFVGVVPVLAAVAAKESVRILRDGAPGRGHLPTVLVLAAMAPVVGLLAPVVGLMRATPYWC